MQQRQEADASKRPRPPRPPNIKLPEEINPNPTPLHPPASSLGVSSSRLDSSNHPLIDDLDPAATAPPQRHDEFMTSMPGGPQWWEDHDVRARDDDDDDDDDRRFQPGLRFSGLLGISGVVSICIVLLFWQVIGGFYTNNQLRGAAINGGNRLSGAAIRWANLVSDVEQRINMTLTLNTIADSNQFVVAAAMICELGSFRTNAIGGMYLGVQANRSGMACLDETLVNATTAFASASQTLIFWSPLDWNTGSAAAKNLQNGNSGVISCASRCPNASAARPHDVTSSIALRMVWDYDNFSADVEALYPAVNFSVPADQLADELARGAALDPGLHNLRVFPFPPDDQLIFVRLTPVGTVYIVTLDRTAAFTYVFGYDNNQTNSNMDSYAQPFRFSSTAFFVETAVPSDRLFHFRRVVDDVTRSGFFAYRPYVGNNVTPLMSTTASLEGSEDARDADVDLFQTTCAGAMMPSRFSTFIDFPFRIKTNGWRQVELALPDSEPVTPNVVYSIQYNPMTETVVMCGQVCQISDDVSVEGTWATVNNSNSDISALPNYCPLNNGQRVFIMSYSHDASDIILVTNTVLNTVGWLAIAAVLLLHTIIYAVLAVPIRYLRSRVMATLQERPMKVALARHIITSLTRRVWLGEVKSLSTAVVAVLMKYQDNKRYLPDYVKRRQHNEDLNVALAEADRLESYQVATGAFEPRLAAREATPEVPDTTNTLNAKSPQASEGRHTAASLAEGAQATVDEEAAIARHKSRGTNLTQVPAASVLVINLQTLEDAYVSDFARTEPLHLKVVADLLHIIRRHGGEQFGRDGVTGGATWNVFDPDSYHVLHAVQCALDVAEHFRPLRDRGFRIGLAVHTGPVISGVMGDAYTVHHVVLGVTVTIAANLAVLNCQMSGVSMLVTQPVRQATNIYHEYLAVDAVVSEEDKARGITPNMLFDVRAGRTRSALEDRPSALSAAQSERNAFAEKYNAAFAQFRIHDFAGALTTMNDILRKEESAARGGVVSMSRRMDPIFARLYRLVMYYRRHQELLPKPYSRLIPAWMLYESSADALQPDTLGGSMNPASSSPSDRQAVNGGGLGRPSVVSEIPSSSLPTGSVGGAHFASPLQPLAYGTQFRTQLEEHLEKRGHKRTGSGQSANVPLNRIPTSTTSIQSPSARFPTNQSLEVPPPLSISPVHSDAAFAAEPDSTHTGGGSLSSRGNCHTKVTPSEGARESNSHSHSSTSGTSPAAAAPSAAKLSETVDFASSFKHGTFSNSLMRWGAPRPNNGAVVASLRRSTKAVVAPPPAESASPKPFELITEGELTDDAFQVNPQHQDEFNAGLTDDEDDGEAADDAQVQQHANDVDAHLPDSFTARGKLFRRSNKVIGRTTVGTVFMGMENSTGRMVSVRVLPLPEKSAVEQWELEGDAARFARVRGHPNVVEFHGFAFAGDSLMLALEHVGAGTLESLLKSFQKVPVVTAVNYIRDVLSGVNVLHLEGICHGQLCLENIFVSTTGVCKLTLHDATKWMREMRSTWHEMPYHLAPENAAGSPQFKSDVWAVGIIFLQLITGKAPYKFNGEMSRDMFIFQVGTNRLMPSWEAEELPTYVDEFVKCCLEADPAMRKSAEELLSLPLFFV